MYHAGVYPIEKQLLKTAQNKVRGSGFKVLKT